MKRFKLNISKSFTNQRCATYLSKINSNFIAQHLAIQNSENSFSKMEIDSQFTLNQEFKYLHDDSDVV